MYLLMRIGVKIRKLRIDKKMSIEELSKKTGLSTGAISQIERDIVGLSVESLWKIARALDTPISYFFDEPSGGTVIRKNSRREMKLPESNVTYQLLSPTGNKLIEFLLIEIEPGVCSNYELINHEGEECGYIIKGKLLVKLGDEEYYLEEGDSIYYNSSIPHRFINVGDETCISIWAMTPPSF